jgi:hypothetical protein
MPPPTTEILQRSATEYYNLWNFPNCVGALDGKHVVFQAPPNSGTLYYNYKKTFSVVLMALVDAKYRFLAIDVGGYGRNSDGGIFGDSIMGRALESGKFYMPADTPLPNDDKPMPHVILADEAFPLKDYLMRPFPQTRNDAGAKIFNYRLSRARRMVESTFGILAARWRIYQRRLQLSPENLERVIRTTCVLHNYCQYEKDEHGTFRNAPELDADMNSNGLENLDKSGFKSSATAVKIRDYFKTYFESNLGAVAWQMKVVNRGRENKM